MSRPVRLALTACLLVAPLAALGQPAADSRSLDQARRLIDDERPQEALEILEPLSRRRSPSAETFLLLSYGHLMLGDLGAARAALERSLDLDPRSIDAWLLEGAIELDQQNYDAAVAAFRRLQELEPGEASKYDLNIGAALALGGDVATASRHFNSYLRAHRTDAEAYYLVAKNYALAERFDLAVQHLEAAVRLDERMRPRIRRDPTFAPMSVYRPFARLLATDSYRPTPGAHYRRETFDEPYDGGRGPLLTGVLNAVQLSGRRYDPSVEVTEGWALVWTDVRIKVADAPGGGGQIELSAPTDALSAEAWRALSDELVASVREQLALLDLHSD